MERQQEQAESAHRRQTFKRSSNSALRPSCDFQDRLTRGRTESMESENSESAEGMSAFFRHDLGVRTAIRSQVTNILHAVENIQRQLDAFCEEDGSSSRMDANRSRSGRAITGAKSSLGNDSHVISTGRSFAAFALCNTADSEPRAEESESVVTPEADTTCAEVRQQIAMMGDSSASDTLFDLHQALFKPAIPKWREACKISSLISYVHPTTTLFGNYLYVGGRGIDNCGGNHAALWCRPVRKSSLPADRRWKVVELPSGIGASDCYGAFVFSGVLHVMLLSSRKMSSSQIIEDGVTIWSQQAGKANEAAATCITHLPTFRWHFGVALCHTYLVIVGGWEISRPVGKVSAFNLKTNEWEEWPSLPEPLTGPIVLRMKNGLVVVGGFLQNSKPNSKVFFMQFGPSLRKWQSDIVPDTTLGACGAAIFEGRLLVAGGEDSNGRIGKAVAVLDEETGLWLQLPNLLKARCSPVVAVLDQRVLCIGGRTKTKVKTSVEELDLSSWPL